MVNNDRAGIRFERVGEVADAGEALIENNKVHGNSLRLSRVVSTSVMRRTRWFATTCSERRPSPVLPTRATATAWRCVRRTAVGRIGQIY